MQHNDDVLYGKYIIPKDGQLRFQDIDKKGYESVLEGKKFVISLYLIFVSIKSYERLHNIVKFAKG